jgi:type IV secretion system protein VirB6
MFAWVGSQIDAVLNTYVINVVAALVSALAPIALSAMTLWVALYGWAVLRNEVSDALSVFLWKAFKLGLILAVALQSGFYVSEIADTANALGNGVASTFLPAAVSPTTVTSAYAIVDTFNDKSSQLVLDLLKDGGILRPDLLFAAVVTAFGNVIFLCIALFVITIAKVFLTFVIAVGPLFVLCLAWKPTARFFDSWLSMVLNAVVLSWFAFFALGFSAHLGSRIVQAIQDQGSFLGSNFNVVRESLTYCVVMIVMGLICMQAPTLSSALTGGAAIQQGVHIVQNVLMVSRRSGPFALSSSGESGGVGRAGTGLPFAAGRTVGAVAAATSQAAGTMAAGAAFVARRGYTNARTAAYKLAALRGRS